MKKIIDLNDELNEFKYYIITDLINKEQKIGNKIIDTMYSQIEFLRDKQVLSIREQINKLPNKISIISVLFIVPIILLIVLGPFLISFING